MRVPVLLAVVSVVCSSLSSQRIVIPEEYANKDAESLEITPLGWERVRCTQYLGPHLLTKLPRGSRITEIAYRRDGKALPSQTLTRPIAAEWSLRMGNYWGDARSPSIEYLPPGTSFNTLTNVFQRSQVNFPPLHAPILLPGFDLRFKLDRPFTFFGPGLAIDHFSYGQRSVGYYYLVDAVRKDADIGTSATFGAGCPKGRNRGYATPSNPGGQNPLEIVLLGGRPNAPAVCFLGGSRSKWGGIDLPLDLTPAGLTGCSLYVGPVVLLPVATLTSGGAQIDIAIPEQKALAGLQLYSQWLVLDPQINPSAPLTFSNGIDIVTGKTVGPAEALHASFLYGVGNLARARVGFVDRGVALVTELTFQ